MGHFVESEDRRQSLLLHASLDDYVTEDNPARVVEAFIDELDLGALGFDGVEPAALPDLGQGHQIAPWRAWEKRTQHHGWRATFAIRMRCHPQALPEEPAGWRS